MEVKLLFFIYIEMYFYSIRIIFNGLLLRFLDRSNEFRYTTTVYGDGQELSSA